MEASGFLTATSLHQGVQSAVIRGISDLLSDKDLERDATRQPEAARRAAAFAFELLATTPRKVLLIRPQALDVSAWGASAHVEGIDPGPASPGSSNGGTHDERAALAVQLGDELVGVLDVDRWQRQTNGIFFGSPPDVPAGGCPATSECRSVDLESGSGRRAGERARRDREPRRRHPRFPGCVS